jgi:hypothetical protein
VSSRDDDTAPGNGVVACRRVGRLVKETSRNDGSTRSSTSALARFSWICARVRLRKGGTRIQSSPIQTASGSQDPARTSGELVTQGRVAAAAMVGGHIR